eukprot:TRINITY_DN11624_c0_g1_i1.p1 TRINITY_DN11624_c0_g1~~TRINITY_DN11624_c0_g1_i1.p1  ORF type:complete len:334 (-),score=21.78 TRINITY_DN11624_c0_g1_i1:110-1111(-)
MKHLIFEPPRPTTATQRSTQRLRRVFSAKNIKSKPVRHEESEYGIFGSPGASVLMSREDSIIARTPSSIRSRLHSASVETLKRRMQLQKMRHNTRPQKVEPYAFLWDGRQLENKGDQTEKLHFSRTRRFAEERSAHKTTESHASRDFVLSSIKMIDQVRGRGVEPRLAPAMVVPRASPGTTKGIFVSMVRRKQEAVAIANANLTDSMIDDLGRSEYLNGAARPMERTGFRPTNGQVPLYLQRMRKSLGTRIRSHLDAQPTIVLPHDFLEEVHHPPTKTSPIRLRREATQKSTVTRVEKSDHLGESLPTTFNLTESFSVKTLLQSTALPKAYFL